jgi:hypothetical protein
VGKGSRTTHWKGGKHRGGNGGRPPKPGERYQSGDLKPIRDAGTPEAQIKRASIVEAAELLAAMYESRIITDEQYEAGCLYAGLRAGFFAAPFGKAIPLGVAEHIGLTEADDDRPRAEDRPDETEEQKRERILRAYSRADRALKQAGAAERRLVVEIVIDRRQPNWLAVMVSALAHAKLAAGNQVTVSIVSGALAEAIGSLHAFRRGLDALADHFGMRARPAPPAEDEDRPAVSAQAPRRARYVKRLSPVSQIRLPKPPKVKGRKTLSIPAGGGSETGS